VAVFVSILIKLNNKHVNANFWLFAVNMETMRGRYFFSSFLWERRMV